MIMRPPRSPPRHSPNAYSQGSSPHSPASAVTPLRSGSDPTPSSPISPLIFPTLAPGSPAYPSTSMPNITSSPPDDFELFYEPSQNNVVTPERKQSTPDIAQTPFQTPERKLLKSQEVARLKKLVKKSPRSSPYRSVSTPSSGVGSPDSIRLNEGSPPGRLGVAPKSAYSPIPSIEENRNDVSSANTSSEPWQKAQSHRSLFTRSSMVSLRGQALLKRRYGDTGKVGLFQRSSGSFNEAIGKRPPSMENASPNSVILDEKATPSFNHSSDDVKENYVNRVLFQEEVSKSKDPKEGSRDSSPFKNATRALLRSGSARRSRRGGLNSTYTRKSESKAQLFQKMMKSPLSSRGFGAISRGGSSGSSRQMSCGGSKRKKFPTISELCVAIVPIQTLARRYLAKKALVKRRWAIVKVQTCIRQWGAVGEYQKMRTVVMRIQSLQRGIVARKSYRELCQLVNLVVTIQKLHRGRILRGKVAIQHEAATAIQSCARKMLTCEQYVRCVRSIMIIQSVARMLPLRTKFLSYQREKREALDKESAAVAIQSKWRSHACRNEYILSVCDVIVVQSLMRRWADARRAKAKLKDRNAAIVIQSRCRGSSAKRQYDRILGSVLRCQCLLRMWRAIQYVEQVRVSKRETMEHQAATTIESAWRGLIARREYVITVGDLILCQSIVRKYLSAQHFEQLRRQKQITDAATLIQSKFRTHSATKEYVYTISCAIVVESAVRRWLAVKCVEKKREDTRLFEEYWVSVAAAIKIGTCWRRFHDRMQYKRVLKVITLIQSLARRNIASARVQLLRHERSAAATKIQATWRSFSTMGMYLQTILDIVVVQSLARRWVASKCFQELQETKRCAEDAAATKIASEWKRYLCYNKYKQTLRQEKKRENAAVSIQSRWRAHIACDEFTQTVFNIVLVQSLARKLMATRQYEELKHQRDAATKIASSVRGFICRGEYEQTLLDVTTCQSVHRRNMAIVQVQLLRHEKKREIAAVAIQSKWRANVACDEFKQTVFNIVLAQVHLLRHKRSAPATKIQAAWRSFSTRDKYLQTVFDIIVVQSLARRWVGSKCFQELQETKRCAEDAAATKIASEWKRYLCYNEYKQTLRHEKKREIAAVAIQSRWRARAASDVYLLTLVDKSVARLKEKIESDAATTISSSWRRYIYLREYRRIVADIITCQSIYRRNVAMKQLQWLRHTRNEEACAGCIQEIWRAYLTRERFVRVVFNMERPKSVESKSATEIANAWRAFTAQQKYASTVKDVTLCQTVIRRNPATKEVKLFKVRVCVTAAVVIQSKWRSWIASKHFRQLARGIISIQCLMRKRRASKYLLQLQMSELFGEVALHEMKAATTIALAWRRFCCQSQYKRNVEASKQAGTIRLQGIVRIQSAWRCHVEKNHFNSTIVKIIKIQALARKLSGRRLTRKLLGERRQAQSDAAVNVQAAWRCCMAKTKFRQAIAVAKVMQHQRQSDSAVLIQSYWRSTAAKKRFVVAAVSIQSQWRAVIASRNFATMLIRIVAIQSIVRRNIAMSRLDEIVAPLLLNEHRDVPRLMIDTEMTDGLISDHQKSQDMAAVKIQAVYRQHRCTANWSRTIRASIKCQSIIRMWRAVASAHELRGYRNEGPSDIFSFIKTRHVATTKIQQTYQDYTTRTFDKSYQDYLCRLNHSIEKSAENEIVKKVSFCEPAAHEVGSQHTDLNAEICDLHLEEEDLEEEFLEEAPITPAASENIEYAVDEDDVLEEEFLEEAPITPAASENIEYAVDEDDENLESQCFESSRCGLSDGVHEVLMVSGKWLYDCLGEPNDEEKEDLLTVMEIGEEAAFCCWKKKPSTDDITDADAAVTKDRCKEASAVVIQSNWRSHAASRDYNRAMEDPVSVEVENVGKSDALEQERAIVRFQTAVRDFLLSKHLQMSSKSKVAKRSPVHKYVDKTGDIETLLNETYQDDASLTDYSETESSIGMMSDIFEGSTNVL